MNEQCKWTRVCQGLFDPRALEGTWDWGCSDESSVIHFLPLVLGEPRTGNPSRFEPLGTFGILTPCGGCNHKMATTGGRYHHTHSRAKCEGQGSLFDFFKKKLRRSKRVLKQH